MDCDQLIDWVGGGNTFQLDGEIVESYRNYSYRFDSAIHASLGDDIYACIYEKLGTKALILKNGEVLREINRSFYQAHVYEYPICFIPLANNKLGLAHCPHEYNILEIEEVETGKLITVKERDKPLDCFFSRLRSNESGSHLINAGWVWHPVDIFMSYDVKEIINDISIFDDWAENPIAADVCSAEFLSDELVVISTANGELANNDEQQDLSELYAGEIGVFSVKKNQLLKKISVDFKTGSLIPINEDFVLCLLDHPKLVNLKTGAITQEFKDIKTGQQESSIIHYIDTIPDVSLDLPNKRLAIIADKSIELLSWN